MFMRAVAAIVLGHEEKMFVTFPVLIGFLKHRRLAERELQDCLVGEVRRAGDIVEGVLEVFNHDVRSTFVADNEFE